MAVLGSILFNRNLKQFLDCQDLSTRKGKGLTKKIRQSASDSLEKLLEIIPSTQNQHRQVLMEICKEHAKGKSEQTFLDILEHDATDIRSTAAEVLSESSQINPAKLFKLLHETNVSKSEIIGILSFQKQFLKPEQIITNALKLDEFHAEQLLKLTEGSEVPLDLESVIVDPEHIQNPNSKIILLRYFAGIEQPGVANLIGKFLADGNKTIVMEALKSLIKLKVPYDASTILPFVETMTENEREMAMEIISKQANEELVPKLAPWTTGKSDELREFLIKVIIKHITQKSLEKFLQRLDQQEWWGKDKAIKCMQKFGTTDDFYNIYCRFNFLNRIVGRHIQSGLTPS